MFSIIFFINSTINSGRLSIVIEMNIYDWYSLFIFEINKYR